MLQTVVNLGTSSVLESQNLTSGHVLPLCKDNIAKTWLGRRMKHATMQCNAWKVDDGKDDPESSRGRRGKRKENS